MQCNLLKRKLQGNAVSSFQTVSCNSQLAWSIPLIYWLPTGGHTEEPGKQTIQSSVRIWNASAALHWMEWSVYCWSTLVNLYSKSELQESRALWAAVSFQMCLYCEEQATTKQHKCTCHLLCYHCSPEGGGCMALRMSVIFTTLTHRHCQKPMQWRLKKNLTII